MSHMLVFRKNGYIGLYDMDNKSQRFNTTPDLLPNSLKLEFGEGEHIINVAIEGNKSVNPLGLPSLEEYLGLG